MLTPLKNEIFLLPLRFLGCLSLSMALISQSHAAVSNAPELLYWPYAIKTMRIENYAVSDQAIQITTTGAIFHVDPNSGELLITQRIGQQRLIAKIKLPQEIRKLFLSPPNNSGFDLVWTDTNPDINYLSMTISGDSLLRIQGVKKLDIQLEFVPQFVKINPPNQGMVALDNWGGLVIMPPDELLASEFQIHADPKKWVLDSKVPSPVICIGIAPPRLFDEKRAAETVVHYSSHIQRYPSDEEIAKYSVYAKTLELHQWVWKNRYVNLHDGMGEPYSNTTDSDTPLFRDGAAVPQNYRWIPDNEMEFTRVIKTAHAHGMRVAPYFGGGLMEPSSVIPEATRLKNTYGIDGLYIDGLLSSSKGGPIATYLVARDLRTLFGDDGWLNYHNSHDGYFAPFIQSYMDYITMSEHTEFDRWTSTTYGISNAIGSYWPEIPFFFPDSMKNMQNAIPYLKDLVDESLHYNNRLLMMAGDQGQWRFWRLFFNQQETDFMLRYYVNRLPECAGGGCTQNGYKMKKPIIGRRLWMNAILRVCLGFALIALGGVVAIKHGSSKTQTQRLSVLLFHWKVVAIIVSIIVGALSLLYGTHLILGYL